MAAKRRRQDTKHQSSLLSRRKKESERLSKIAHATYVASVFAIRRYGSGDLFQVTRNWRAIPLWSAARLARITMLGSGLFWKVRVIANAIQAIETKSLSQYLENVDNKSIIIHKTTSWKYGALLRFTTWIYLDTISAEVHELLTRGRSPASRQT